MGSGREPWVTQDEVNPPSAVISVRFIDSMQTETGRKFYRTSLFRGESRAYLHESTYTSIGVLQRDLCREPLETRPAHLLGNKTMMLRHVGGRRDWYRPGLSVATHREENAGFSHCRTGGQEQHVTIVWGGHGGDIVAEDGGDTTKRLIFA